MRKTWLAPLIFLAWSASAAAQSRYARPPDDVPPDDLDPASCDPYAQGSSVRLSVGPVMRLAAQGVDGGLGTGVDIGSRGAGARLSGAWVGVGGDRGLSQYDAQLWLDFGHGRRVHPIVAAGAGIARVDRAAEDGSIAASTVGIGLLRAALEYVLPIAGADARAGVDVEGALPAIRSAGSPAVGAWLVGGAHVAVGF